MANPQKHTLKHLKTLGFEDADTVHLRVLSEGGVKVAKPFKCKLSSLDFSALEKEQENGWGVHVVLNPGGTKSSDISHSRVFFYEHDDLELEESRVLWQSLRLPEPTMQVFSGSKSIHSYWILHEPIAIAEWLDLQHRLIEYAKADPAVSAAKTLRLAGFKHPKTGDYTLISGGCGQRYTLDEIFENVPKPKKPDKVDWAGFNRGFRLPIQDTIPIEICLAKETQQLLASGVNNNRNTVATKVAFELVAIADYLKSLNQGFDGDPCNLFLDFCGRCGGEGFNEKEWTQIWQSAVSSPRAPTLSPESIHNCIRGWVWRNRREFLVGADNALKSLPSPQPIDIEEPDEEGSEEEILRADIANYAKVARTGSRFQLIPLANKIKKRHKVNDAQIEDLCRELDEQNRSELTATGDLMIEICAEVEDKAESGEVSALRVGFDKLDAMTGGLHKQDLIIAAGRPSMGKTALVLNMAEQIAMLSDLPVAFFSLEMSKKQLAYRMISTKARIARSALEVAQLEDNEWSNFSNAIAYLSELPIYIDDSSCPNPDEIRIKCQRLQDHTQKPLGMVAIDYLQLMGTGDDPVIEIARISRSLKMTAKALDCPVICLSQLSRGVESRPDKRPMMSDLRQSGAIEQDADLIMMLYRDDYYKPDSKDKGLAEVILCKHRNGPTGTVKLGFDAQYTRFYNYSEDED